MTTINCFSPSNANSPRITKVPAGKTVNTDHLDALVAQLEHITDPNAASLLIHQHLDQLTTSAQKIIDEQAKQLEKILPILHLPGPNPFAIVKWIGKLVTGTAIPQLEAYIKYTQQAIHYATAVGKIAAAASKAISTIEHLPSILTAQLKQAETNFVKKNACDLQRKISNEVAGAINSANAGSAISDILQGIAEVKQAIQTTTQLQSSLTSTVNNSLGSVAQAQSAITGVTGGTNHIDTSSVDNFQTSIAGGALDRLKTDTIAMINVVAPTNTVLPNVTGTNTIGSTLTVNNGTWTGDNLTYTYQWYSSTLITGATNSTYVIATVDVGYPIYCIVTASNTAGQIPATSNSISVTSVSSILTNKVQNTFVATGINDGTMFYSFPVSFTSGRLNLNFNKGQQYDELITLGSNTSNFFTKTISRHSHAIDDLAAAPAATFTAAINNTTQMVEITLNATGYSNVNVSFVSTLI